MTEIEEAVGRLKQSVNATRYDDLMTLETALASERERADRADAMALEAIAQRDHAEAALAALKAEALEVVGMLTFGLETTDACLRTWNDGRGGPANVEGMVRAARAFADKYRGEGDAG